MDNQEEFCRLTSSPGFDLNARVEWPFRMLDIGIPVFRLIDMAAVMGSVKIFRHLLLNKGEATHKTVWGAIAGGSIEIVRLCHQAGIPFENAQFVAAQFRRNDILDWLIENVVEDIGEFDGFGGMLLRSCVIGDNITGIVRAVESGCGVCEPSVSELGSSYCLASFYALRNLGMIDESTPGATTIENAARSRDMELMLEYRRKIEEIEDGRRTRKERYAMGEDWRPGIDDEEWTNYPLIYSMNDIEFVSEMVQKLPFDINGVGKNFKNALSQSASNDDIETVKKLLSIGADVNEPRGSLCAIHFAAWHNNIPMLSFLLSMEGIEVNARDHDRQTAAHLAVWAKSEEAVGVLASDARIDWSAKDRTGDSPLIVASKNNNSSAIRAILPKLTREEANEKNKDGLTALTEALRGGYLEAAEALLESDKIDRDLEGGGCTPLSWISRDPKLMRLSQYFQ